MAASITKTLPRTFNFLSNCLYGSTRVTCCCRKYPLLKINESQFTNHSNRQSRHIFTYSQLRQSNIVEVDSLGTRPVEETADTVEDTDEPDVLYKKVVIEVKGHDESVLKSYAIFVKMACRYLDIHIAKFLRPKVHYERQTMAKSVFVYKKHYSQYEHRTHFAIFEINKLTGSTTDTLLEYIQRNLPEGTAMKVTKHRLEKFPENLVPPTEEKPEENLVPPTEEKPEELGAS